MNVETSLVKLFFSTFRLYFGDAFQVYYQRNSMTIWNQFFMQISSPNKVRSVVNSLLWKVKNVDPVSVMRRKTRKHESKRKWYAGVDAIYFLHPVTFYDWNISPDARRPSARCAVVKLHLFFHLARVHTLLCLLTRFINQPSLWLICSPRWWKQIIAAQYQLDVAETADEW